MAVQDPTKKKRDNIPRTGAFGYDVTGATPATEYDYSRGGGVGGGGGTGTPAPAAPTAPAAPQVNRTLAGPQAEYQKARAGYDAATNQLGTLRKQRGVLTQSGAGSYITNPGLESLRVPEQRYTGPNGTGGALRAIDQRIAQTQHQRESYIPTFNNLTQQFNAQAEQNRTNTALRSVGAAPVKRQLAGSPAPAAPTTPTAQPARGGVGTSTSGGSAGTGVTPASSPPAAKPAGTFVTGDGRTEQLPAGISVRRLPNGSNEFTGSAASIAAATGNAAPAAAAPVTRTLAPVMPAATAEAPQAPAVYGRSLNGDVSGAERERAAALAGIDNQLLRVKPNTRGRREFIADLLGLKRQLTGQRVDQATTLASQGAQLDNTAAIEAAQLAQRTGESNANRGLDAQRINIDAESKDADRQAQNLGVNRLLLDRNGNTSVLRNDGSLDQLSDAEGNAFQQAPDPDLVRAQTVSPDAQYKALSDRLTQLQQFGAPEGQEDAYNKQVGDLQAQLAALEGGGKKTPVRTGTQNGRKVVQYSDGSIEYAD